MGLKVPANGFDPYGAKPLRPLRGKGKCICVGWGMGGVGERLHVEEQTPGFVKAIDAEMTTLPSECRHHRCLRRFSRGLMGDHWEGWEQQILQLHNRDTEHRLQLHFSHYIPNSDKDKVENKMFSFKMFVHCVECTSLGRTEVSAVHKGWTLILSQWFHLWHKRSSVPSEGLKDTKRPEGVFSHLNSQYQQNHCLIQNEAAQLQNQLRIFERWWVIWSKHSPKLCYWFRTYLLG